jgi:hypothetical protein
VLQQRVHDLAMAERCGLNERCAMVSAAVDVRHGILREQARNHSRVPVHGGHRQRSVVLERARLELG